MAPTTAVGSDPVIAEISGQALRIIEAARLAYVRDESDLSGYQVTVSDAGNIFVVHFSDPDRPHGQRGSSSNRREFSVEVDKQTLRAVRYIGVR